MSKDDGLFTVCICTGKNTSKEQRKCNAYREGKKGYCTYYRVSIGACSNYDGAFSITENR
jgi:hypothetical protein